MPALLSSFWDSGPMSVCSRIVLQLGDINIANYTQFLMMQQNVNLMVSLGLHIYVKFIISLHMFTLQGRSSSSFLGSNPKLGNIWVCMCTYTMQVFACLCLNLLLTMKLKFWAWPYFWDFDLYVRTYVCTYVCMYVRMYVAIAMCALCM